ncbi:MAG TPA: TolC family protein, partial [Gemmatimonadaceae bacterium]
MSHTTRYLQAISLLIVVFLAGCGNPPRVNGAAGASPSPSVPWTPPAGAIKPESLLTPIIAIAVPADLQQRIRQLTLIDVVDLALLNNPATRASWAQARATAYLFGSAQGQYFPTINGTGTASRIKSPATLARPAGLRTEYGPSLSLNYLLVDFGGRSGSIEK